VKSLEFLLGNFFRFKITKIANWEWKWQKPKNTVLRNSEKIKNEPKVIIYFSILIKLGGVPIESIMMLRGEPRHLLTFQVPCDENRYSFLTQDITEVKISSISVLNVHQIKELQKKLEKQTEHLEEQVKARTKQLEEALQVKSRFLATMSHGSTPKFRSFT
jgi:hypothetical protein